MLHTVLIAVVYVLAVMRLTRLLNFDTLLNPIRARLPRPVIMFVICPWCVGFWVCVATAWVPIYFADHPVVVYAGVVLAASHLIGLFAPLTYQEDVEVEVIDAESSTRTR